MRSRICFFLYLLIFFIRFLVFFFYLGPVKHIRKCRRHIVAFIAGQPLWKNSLVRWVSNDQGDNFLSSWKRFSVDRLLSAVRKSLNLNSSWLERLLDFHKSALQFDTCWNHLFASSLICWRCFEITLKNCL